MIKTNNKNLTKLINSRKLSPFRKYLKFVKVVYDKNDFVGITHYDDRFQKIVFVNKDDMTPLIFIHEMTHFRDYTKNNTLRFTPKSMAMYITEKQNKVICKALNNKMTKAKMMNILERVNEKDYFKRYKHKKQYESFLMDIFNSITGGKYAKEIYGSNVNHDRKYYGNIYPKLLETNADFTALIHMCGKDKIRKIFKDLDQAETYRNISKLHTIIKGGYIK